MGQTAFIELRGIGKEFSGVRVLEDVSMKIMPGKVYALMGENGAGKSTLCNIILGSLKPSEGKLVTDMGEFEHFTLEQAKSLGVRMVHQELQVLPEMGVAENLFVGNEVHKNGWIRTRELNRRTRKLLDTVGLDVDPQTAVKKLDIAARQLLEIARAEASESRMIILDEPTSSLSSKEVEKLFEIINQRKKKGIAFLFISHRLEEVMKIADEILVLKDGKLVKSLHPKETDENEIIRNMVGREYKDFYNRKREFFGKELLRTEHLSAEPGKNSYLNAYAPRDVSFSVSEGEVLGFAGLVGAGRTEMLRLLFGRDIRTKNSRIFIDGEEVEMRSMREAMSHGMGWITEDRKNEGLILEFPIMDNIALPILKKMKKGAFVNPQKIEQVSVEYQKRLEVKATGSNQKVKFLSGGNQQKVVLAKWLATHPRILVLDEPTRGIDVGAKVEIYKLINQLTAKGMAVVFISSELPEVIGMSDRIVVMHEGKVTGILDRDEFSEERIMLYATGRKNDYD